MSARQVVHGFLVDVRSGRHLHRVSDYLAPSVAAHQVQAEHKEVVERTPAQYADHVRDLLDQWGPFALTVDELICEGDKAYARWTQDGHVTVGAESRPVRQITSATYRVSGGKIAEYWIQIERLGLQLPLRPPAAPDRRDRTAP